MPLGLEKPDLFAWSKAQAWFVQTQGAGGGRGEQGRAGRAVRLPMSSLVRPEHCGSISWHPLTSEKPPVHEGHIPVLIKATLSGGGRLQDVMVGMFLGPCVIKSPTSCGWVRNCFLPPDTDLMFSVISTMSPAPL